MTDFVEHFGQRKEGGANPPWLRAVNQQAMDRFLKLGLPTTRQEEWKYTSVEPLRNLSLSLPAEKADAFRAEEVEALSPLSQKMKGEIRLVFLNGRFAPHLSYKGETTKGAVVVSLADALQTHPSLVESHLGRLASYKDHPFVALNTAFISDGAFLFIPKGAVMKSPVHLIFVSNAEDKDRAIVTHPRNLIIAEEGAQASVIESFVGRGSGTYFTNTVTEIAAADGAVIEHYKVQKEGEGAFHIGTLCAEQGRQANLSTTSLSLGGSLARNDLSTILKAEGATCLLNGFYLVSDRQHVDHHTSIDHAKPHCTSGELYKGILGGSATGVFDGRIIVRPDAQKTNARQTNKNLILSDQAIMNSRPLLEIFANDVKCNHGATIGRLDENQIFYLRSRGIREAQARNILTSAFAGEILKGIKIEGLRSWTERIVMERLAREQGVSGAFV